MPDHPRASNGYVMEHIVLAERALGRSLPLGAEIHHVDENKKNNAGGNLVLCPDRSYHWLLHQRQRALDACGDPNALRCDLCHEYDRQEEIIVRPTPSGGKVGRHRSCKNAAGRVKRPWLPRQKTGRRSHCRRGHAMTPENSYFAPKSGLRSCRTCRAENARKDAPRCELTITPLSP